MNIRTLAIAGFTSLVLLNAGTLSWARPLEGAPAKPWMKERAAKRHYNFEKELNLTAEQQEQLRAHRQEQRAKTQEVHQQMQAKRKELKEELHKTDTSREKLNSLVAEIKNLYGQLLDARVEGVLFTKSVLSPEQFAKFDEKIQSRRERGQETRPKKGRR